MRDGTASKYPPSLVAAAVRQRFGGGIDADLCAVRSDESGSKARAALADKLLEGHTSQSNQPHQIVTVPPEITRD